MDDILKVIGERLRIIRKDKGFTQEELAEKSDLPHTTIGLAERGDRNISLLTLQKILNGLEISPLFLFNFADIEQLKEELNKNQLLEEHINLFQSRTYEEQQSIHQIVNEIIKFKEK